MGGTIKEGELYDHSPEVNPFRFLYIVTKLIYA
jgi:hypothetical protein